MPQNLTLNNSIGAPTPANMEIDLVDRFERDDVVYVEITDPTSMLSVRGEGILGSLRALGQVDYAPGDNVGLFENHDAPGPALITLDPRPDRLIDVRVGKAHYTIRPADLLEAVEQLDIIYQKGFREMLD